MARIAGVDLPRHKQIVYALPYLFGIGQGRRAAICATTGIPPTKMTEELTEAESRRSATCSTPTTRSKAICAARSR